MTLNRHFSLVGAATLLSRLTGFARDILLAALLGTSSIAEAFVAAYILPNLIRRVASEGAFNAALVPRLSRIEAEAGREAVVAFAGRLVVLVAAALVLLTAAALLLMPQVIGLVAPGFEPGSTRQAEAVLLARIVFPFAALSVLAAVLSAFLNASERYALAALTPVMLNLALIVVLAAMLLDGRVAAREAGLAIAVTILLTGVAQVGVLRLAALRHGLPLLPAAGGSGLRDAGRVLARMLPGLVVAGAGHMHIVVASQFASAEPRAVAWLYYADRLFQLPLGFVAAAVGVVLLPRFSREWHGGRPEAALAAQQQALVFAVLLTLPAMVGLLVLARPIVSVLFVRGAFGPADAAAAAEILSVLALALPFFVLVKVLLPTFLAAERLRAPLLAALAGLGLNLLATGSGLVPSGPAGPAAGIVAGAAAHALLLLAASAGRLAVPRILVRRLLAAALAAAVMGLAVHGLHLLLAGLLDPARSLPEKALALALLCGTGLLVHGAAALLLGAVDRPAWLPGVRNAGRRPAAGPD